MKEHLFLVQLAILFTLASMQPQWLQFCKTRVKHFVKKKQKQWWRGLRLTFSKLHDEKQMEAIVQ